MAKHDAYFKVKKYKETSKVFRSRIATTDFVANGFNHWFSMRIFFKDDRFRPDTSGWFQQ